MEILQCNEEEILPSNPVAVKGCSQGSEGWFCKKIFSNCCGIVDGRHLPLELSRGENSVDYYDYKHNIFVSMHAIVDAKVRSIDVYA